MSFHDLIIDDLVAERDAAVARLRELHIAIHGACGCPAPYTEVEPQPEHRWTASGGNGTATIVSKIGGPAFAVLRRGEPDVGLADMVAAALNYAQIPTPDTGQPEPTDMGMCGA